MNKQEICTRLTKDHHSYTAYVDSLAPADFLFAPVGKWSAGQQLDHILRSVSAVRQALRLPKFVLRLIFPEANRPSKTYEGLVTKYQLKLQTGGRAGGRFVPSTVKAEQKESLAINLNAEIKKLCSLIDHYSEGQLDSFVLPHPLLGKLTLREMLYFTIYHVQHHQKLIADNLTMRN